MKSLFLCLALAVLPACGEQRGALLAPIALYTQFQQPPPASVLEALQDEVDALMSPMDLNFAWRSLPVSGTQVSVELAVVTFMGRCDVAGLLPHNANPGVLGKTHISDGDILPFADIDCDGIRGFVGKELLMVKSSDRDAVFGRALGRVVAHELYHILANTTHHGVDGVGKPAYSVHELLADEFHFQEKEAVALRTSKAHMALEIITPPIDPQ